MCNVTLNSANSKALKNKEYFFSLFFTKSPSFSSLYTQTWLVVHVHRRLIIEGAHLHHQEEQDLALLDVVLRHLEDAVPHHHQQGAMTTAVKETEAVQTRDTVDAIHPMDTADSQEPQTLMVLPFVQKKAIQICKSFHRCLTNRGWHIHHVYLVAHGWEMNPQRPFGRLRLSVLDPWRLKTDLASRKRANDMTQTAQPTHLHPRRTSVAIVAAAAVIVAASINPAKAVDTNLAAAAEEHTRAAAVDMAAADTNPAAIATVKRRDTAARLPHPHHHHRLRTRMTRPRDHPRMKSQPWKSINHSWTRCKIFGLKSRSICLRIWRLLDLSPWPKTKTMTKERTAASYCREKAQPWPPMSRRVSVFLAVVKLDWVETRLPSLRRQATWWAAVDTSAWMRCVFARKIKSSLPRRSGWCCSMRKSRRSSVKMRSFPDSERSSAINLKRKMNKPKRVLHTCKRGQQRTCSNSPFYCKIVIDDDDSIFLAVN